VLIFVNSIKTARRLDGLLRALELNSRTIHAQMQQRQRLRALESYQAASTAILVATDVAARGLDISKIQYVIHYDVARSPQVYIHRSGRTARAGDTGTTISMVAPEDTGHHAVICSAQGMKSLPAYKGDLHLLPKLDERVQLAKKIFTLSFVHSQQTKSASWLQTTAQEAELELDDNMLFELEEDAKHAPKQGLQPGSTGVTGGSKKGIEKAKKALKALLSKPLHESAVTKQMNSARIPESQKRRGFVVFAR